MAKGTCSTCKLHKRIAIRNGLFNYTCVDCAGEMQAKFDALTSCQYCHDRDCGRKSGPDLRLYRCDERRAALDALMVAGAEKKAAAAAKAQATAAKKAAKKAAKTTE